MGFRRSEEGQRARLFLLGFASLILLVAVAGLSALVYEVARPDHDQAEVQAVSTGAESTTRPTPSPSPSPTPSPAPTPFFEAKPFRIAIDKLGVDAPVVTEGLDANQVPVVPLNSYEVAWYDFSAAPGTPGNAVFAGHKTWAGQAVFYNLDQLQPGDVIRLTADDGSELAYTVTDSFTVREDDPNAVSVMSPTDTPVMTIITCDGTRYYTGDPVYGHDYTERRVVRAVPSSMTPPPAG